jgi:integration host factor subunit beta
MRSASLHNWLNASPRSRSVTPSIAVKTILDAMSDALAKGHRIEIRGFGSFSINRRPPRVGRNPRSGEQVTIPEKLVPHFKPGKALREAVDACRPCRTSPQHEPPQDCWRARA